jgi:S-DNA-T family DNA segregation ATPase FtsK/SpoIIIE
MTTFREMRLRGELADFAFGDVFLVIDNFGQFYQEFDTLESDLVDIVNTGLTYGVHLIAATSRWMEIRSKIRDNIGTRLELRLNDPMDSEFGKAVASLIPTGVPGRGANKEKLHFQIALPLLASTIAQDNRGQQVQEDLMGLIKRAKDAWQGPGAPPINMLPSLVPFDMLPAPAPDQPAGVPLGLEEFRLDPFYIDIFGSGGPHFIILGDSESGKTSLLRTWMRGLEQRYDSEKAAFCVIDFRKQLLDFAESKHMLMYGYNSQTLTSVIANMKVTLEKRRQKTSDVPLAELRRPQKFNGRHFFLIIDDYETILSGSNSPVGQLAEFLLAGHDMGFHLILTHRVGGVGRASFETVFQRLKEMGTSGILMSGDPSEGRILHNQATLNMPPGRGIFVQAKHPPMLLQTAFIDPGFE